MPGYSTLNTFLALGLAVSHVQATVSIPFVQYVDGPSSILPVIPDNYTYYGNERQNGTTEDGAPEEFTYGQGRRGFHMRLGTPGSHVFLTPNYYSKDTFINSVWACDEFYYDEYIKYEGWNLTTSDLRMCEQSLNGVFAQNESSTYTEVIINDYEAIGRDRATFVDTASELTAERFEFHLVNETFKFMGSSANYLGLGRGSNVFSVFGGGQQKFGISFPFGGRSSDGKLQLPQGEGITAPMLGFELELGGFNESNFKGEKFTQPLGQAPLRLNVTGITIGPKKEQLLEKGESFLAEMDLTGNGLDTFPRRIYDKLGKATLANETNPDLPEGSGHGYLMDKLPTDPKEWLNMTVHFSNGFSVSVPQNLLIQDLGDMTPDDGRPRTGWGNVMSSEDTLQREGSSPYRGPVIALRTLMLDGYVGVDYDKDELFLASNKYRVDIPETSNAWGVGNSLNKRLMALFGMIATLYMLA